MAHEFLGSVGGALQHVLLLVPEYEAEYFAAIYGALIGSLPDNCKFTIIAEPGARDHIQSWPLDAARSTNISITDTGNLGLTPWARDPVLALHGDNRIRLIISKSLDRRDDLKAISLLAKQDAIEITEAEIAFEGGNMLFGEDQIFIGADTIHALDDQEAIRTLVPAGCKSVVIGCGDQLPSQLTRPALAGQEEWQEIFHYRSKQGARQPIFHIDMFMSLAGKDADGQQIVLVGDPAMAADILGTPLHPLSLSEKFDAIADDLAAQGFTVIRNPLPMIYMDDIKKRIRTWIYASSNNVLVQQCPQNGKIVWMPEYGHDNWPELALTDVKSREIWENLGFEVRLIPNGQMLAENLGGLHCLTNVLKRG